MHRYFGRREDNMSLTRREVLLSTSAVALTNPITSSAYALTPSTASPKQAGNIALAQAAPSSSEKGTTGIGLSSTAMQRADDLLRQMTIEEKAMQLSSVFPVGM